MLEAITGVDIEPKRIINRLADISFKKFVASTISKVTTATEC